ncbi:MAG: lipopolysaccharide heptosyltransferase II [Terriglobia bacterium]|nr:MAG: lipopolysaccharide heptosyltransferase II [Terriglobia bacterium]
MELNPSSVSKVLVRATNWLGDAVMSLPAIRAVRQIFPHAHLAVVARHWVADLYARESAIDQVIPYEAQLSLAAKRAFAGRLRTQNFDCAILLQNAFDAALMAWMARIPERIGYRRDGRGLLLTQAIPVPDPGDIPRHERFYYLELLRRCGLIEHFPPVEFIRLDGIEQARAAGLRRLAAMGISEPVIGISPGAAYGNAKRWPPERFVETAGRLGHPALVFGSAAEHGLCEQVAHGLGAPNLAGKTSLGEFIDLAASCRLFLTNDSGAMHVASALGVPTIAIFGATDDTATGPTGPFARVVREHAECSPCLLRDCPIDHRCMRRVTSDQVATAALQLWEDTAPAWTHEARS